MDESSEITLIDRTFRNRGDGWGYQLWDWSPMPSTFDSSENTVDGWRHLAAALNEIQRVREAIGWLITEQAVTWYEATVYGWENGIEVRKPAPPEVIAVLTEVDHGR
jgi:hypothetical protein